MAKHEFGIMIDSPQPGKRYDKYEPEKYACISVDDVYLEGIGERILSVDFYCRFSEEENHQRSW